MTARRTLLAALSGLGLMGCAHAGAYEDFFRAIEVDNGEAVAALLRRGFDPNTRNARRDPALVVALHGESPKAAAALLQARGLQVNARNGKGETALLLAALRGLRDGSLLAPEPVAALNLAAAPGEPGAR